MATYKWKVEAFSREQVRKVIAGDAKSLTTFQINWKHSKRIEVRMKELLQGHEEIPILNA